MTGAGMTKMKTSYFAAKTAARRPIHINQKAR
jgi:hypothetical protein